jgi:hypothetical protein
MKKKEKRNGRVRRAEAFGARSEPGRRGYLFRTSFLSLFYGGSYCKIEIDFRRKGESIRALQLFCRDKLVNWTNTDVNQSWYRASRKRRNKGEDAQAGS